MNGYYAYKPNYIYSDKNKYNNDGDDNVLNVEDILGISNADTHGNNLDNNPNDKANAKPNNTFPMYNRK